MSHDLLKLQTSNAELKERLAAQERSWKDWTSKHATQGRDIVHINNDCDSAGASDKEFSDVEFEYISLPKIKRQILRADATGDHVYLCCMPRPDSLA